MSISFTLGWWLLPTAFMAGVMLSAYFTITDNRSPDPTGIGGAVVGLFTLIVSALLITTGWLVYFILAMLLS